MSDNEGSVPTEGTDYGDTMVVWPSTGRIPGGDVKPGGSSGLAPSMPPGWGDYSPQGIALVQSVLFPGIIRRIILDKELEEGDWSGWSVSVHSPWGNEKVSAARTVLENGLRGGLPEPSRPAAVSFARLEPASGNGGFRIPAQKREKYAERAAEKLRVNRYPLSPISFTASSTIRRLNLGSFATAFWVYV